MAVLELGTLSLNRLLKPGKGWETGVEGVLLGVEDSRWMVTELAQEGSAHLTKAVQAFLPDTMTPGKLQTLLQADERKSSHLASGLHVMDYFISNLLEPEVRKVLAEAVPVKGVTLPRWQLQFVPMAWLSQAPAWQWDMEQVNAYASHRVS